jgi:hypothetical protein
MCARAAGWAPGLDPKEATWRAALRRTTPLGRGAAATTEHGGWNGERGVSLFSAVLLETEIHRRHPCSGQATEGGIASAGPAGLASRVGAATTSGLSMTSTRANHVNHGGVVHHHHPSVRRNAPPRMPLAARQSRSMQW